MPLNKKGLKIRESMEKFYGKKKGEAVFYASENKGNIKGVTKKAKKDPMEPGENEATENESAATERKEGHPVHKKAKKNSSSDVTSNAYETKEAKTFRKAKPYSE
jgi:hypothetical protein